MNNSLISALELRGVIDSAISRSKVLNIFVYLYDWRLVFYLEYVDSAGRKYRYIFPESLSSGDDLPKIKDLRLIRSNWVHLSLGEALIYNIINVGGKHIWGVYKGRVFKGISLIKGLKGKFLSWGFVPKNRIKDYNTASLAINISLNLPMDINKFIGFQRYLPCPKGVSVALFNRIVSYLRESNRELHPIFITPRLPIKMNSLSQVKYLLYNSVAGNLSLYIVGYEAPGLVFIKSPEMYSVSKGSSESIVVGKEPLVGSYMDVRNGFLVCTLTI